MNDELVEVDTSKNSNFTSIEYKGSNLLFKRESNETLGLIRVLKTTSAITEIEIPLTIKDESNFKTINILCSYSLENIFSSPYTLYIIKLNVLNIIKNK